MKTTFPPSPCPCDRSAVQETSVQQICLLRCSVCAGDFEPCELGEARSAIPNDRQQAAPIRTALECKRLSTATLRTLQRAASCKSALGTRAQGHGRVPEPTSCPALKSNCSTAQKGSKNPSEAPNCISERAATNPTNSAAHRCGSAPTRCGLQWNLHASCGEPRKKARLRTQSPHLRILLNHHKSQPSQTFSATSGRRASKKLRNSDGRPDVHRWSSPDTLARSQSFLFEIASETLPSLNSVFELVVAGMLETQRLPRTRNMACQTSPKKTCNARHHSCHRDAVNLSPSAWHQGICSRA